MKIESLIKISGMFYLRGITEFPDFSAHILGLVKTSKIFGTTT